MTWSRTWLRTNWNGAIVPGLGLGALLLAKHFGLDTGDASVVALAITMGAGAVASPVDLLLQRWEQAPEKRELGELRQEIQAVREQGVRDGDAKAARSVAENSPAHMGARQSRVTSMDDAFPENRARGKAEQEMRWESAMRLAGYRPAASELDVEPEELPVEPEALKEAQQRLQSRETELYGLLAMGEKSNTLSHEEASAMQAEKARICGTLSAIEARWAAIEKEPAGRGREPPARRAAPAIDPSTPMLTPPPGWTPTSAPPGWKGPAAGSKGQGGSQTPAPMVPRPVPKLDRGPND